MSKLFSVGVGAACPSVCVTRLASSWVFWGCVNDFWLCREGRSVHSGGFADGRIDKPEKGQPFKYILYIIIKYWFESVNTILPCLILSTVCIFMQKCFLT